MKRPHLNYDNCAWQKTPVTLKPGQRVLREDERVCIIESLSYGRKDKTFRTICRATIMQMRRHNVERRPNLYPHITDAPVTCLECMSK